MAEFKIRQLDHSYAPTRERDYNLTAQPCGQVMSDCCLPRFKHCLPSFARKVYWIVATETHIRGILLCTAANDGSRHVPFIHFLRSFPLHSSLHTYCVVQLHCLYTMRHFNSLTVILGVLQLKPASTTSYPSPPTSNGGSIQSLEPRQDSTVVVPSEFLRRGSHACQYYVIGKPPRSL